ncbi:MAG TPA: hypothetical protein VLY63_15905 [Anaerolineae bacterium]|nr:hypothetical protein [Anaerolineae bacterium]
MSNGSAGPSLETPVLLLIFNRPRTTRAVFESIRSARPTRLYVAADGPRDGVEGDVERCQAARQIATSVDWACQVATCFQEHNLGLGVEAHVRSAIDWFMANETEGIVLEDDCVPDPSFFQFCEELLQRYRDVPQVMHISGDNFQYGRWRGDASYYFSRYPMVWGWATWRRAWRQFGDVEETAQGQAKTWAYQWLLTLEKQRGAAIVPNVNLVTNIGFGADATHTKTLERYSMLPSQAMRFPLRHPRNVTLDRAADTFTYYAHYRNIGKLRLIWLHQLWDFTYARLRRIKNLVLPKKPRVGE